MHNATYYCYEDLIWKAVHRFAKKVGYADIDEIKSEANKLFCEAYRSYDESLSSFSTHLTHQLRKLTHMMRGSRSLNKVPNIPDVSRVRSTHSEHSTILEVAEQELSKEAYDMLSMILSLSEETVAAMDNKSEELQKLYHERTGLHWHGDVSVRSTWKECKQWFRNHGEFVSCLMS